MNSQLFELFPTARIKVSQIYSTSVACTCDSNNKYSCIQAVPCVLVALLSCLWLLLVKDSASQIEYGGNEQIGDRSIPRRSDHKQPALEPAKKLLQKCVHKGKRKKIIKCSRVGKLNRKLQKEIPSSASRKCRAIRAVQQRMQPTKTIFLC